MGHGPSRSKGNQSSYQSETPRPSASQTEVDDKLRNGVPREFPQVHNSSSVTSVDSIDGSSLCLSGGAEGVKL